MSTNIVDAVKASLTGRRVAAREPSSDAIHSQEMSRGRRAKRTLDRQLTNQNYYRTQIIHTELLNHYENVDWYERDSKHDFAF